MTSYQHGNYLLDFVYGSLTDIQRQEIIHLWVSSGVLPASEAQQRVEQVVMTMRNRQGILVGVNTAYVQNFQVSGNFYYFYRIFIREQDRGSDLRTRATTLARQLLKDYQGTVPKPHGIIIITENVKYERPGGMRLLRRQGWHYLGRGPRGFNIWFDNFDGSDSIHPH